MLLIRASRSVDVQEDFHYFGVILCETRAADGWKRRLRAVGYITGSSGRRFSGFGRRKAVIFGFVGFDRRIQIFHFKPGFFDLRFGFGPAKSWKEEAGEDR